MPRLPLTYGSYRPGPDEYESNAWNSWEPSCTVATIPDGGEAVSLFKWSGRVVLSATSGTFLWDPAGGLERLDFPGS